MFSNFCKYVIIKVVQIGVIHLSKGLLRFCVLVYKGLLSIAKVLLKIVYKFLGVFRHETDLTKLANKTKNTIKIEKAKQDKIARREAARLKRETEKQEKINEKKRAIQDKKDARIAKIQERKRRKLEKKNELSRIKKSRKKINKIDDDVPKKVNKRKELKEQARLAKIETQTKARIAKEKRA